MAEALWTCGGQPAAKDRICEHYGSIAAGNRPGPGFFFYTNSKAPQQSHEASSRSPATRARVAALAPAMEDAQNVGGATVEIKDGAGMRRSSCPNIEDSGLSAATPASQSPLERYRFTPFEDQQCLTPGIQPGLVVA